MSVSQEMPWFEGLDSQLWCELMYTFPSHTRAVPVLENQCPVRELIPVREREEFLETR